MPAVSLSGQSKQRQIVILAVGALVLGGLLLFQLPRMLDRMNATAPAPSTTQPAPTPVTPQPVSPTPVVPVAPTSASRRELVARFDAKDPFVQQIDPDASPAAPSPAASAPAQDAEAAPAPSSPARRSTARRSTFTVESFATISVNGAKERVRVSATFPREDPVFRLVSAGGGTARIAIAAGRLSGGSGTVVLTRGQPVTLLNTLDGKRYRLALLSVS